MKNYIITSLLFLSLGFSQKEYNSNDLIEMDNGLYTEKFSDEPISGKVYGLFGEVRPYKKVYMGILLKGKREGRWKSYFHSSGKKRYDINFKDGKLDGLSTHWYENGQKEIEQTWKNGEKEGLSTHWYENGQKEIEQTWKNGEKEGLSTYWFENGKKELEQTWKNGKKDGLFTWWYGNGKKESEGTWMDDKIIYIKEWNEDGSVKND
jgi:antitoxin component YwqK of YwqJK toxin-antitoxin module